MTDRRYDPAGYREMPTGYERRFKDGVTVQAHHRTNPEWARKLLEQMDERTDRNG